MAILSDESHDTVLKGVQWFKGSAGEDCAVNCIMFVCFQGRNKLCPAVRIQFEFVGFVDKVFSEQNPNYLLCCAMIAGGMDFRSNIIRLVFLEIKVNLLRLTKLRKQD